MGYFEFSDGVTVKAELTNIDDVETFLENYDEMELWRNKNCEGHLFSNTEEVTEELANQGNLLHFKYTFNMKGVLNNESESNEIIIRFIQYGDGIDCGYSVKISETLDKELLQKWLSYIIENNKKVRNINE